MNHKLILITTTKGGDRSVRRDRGLKICRKRLIKETGLCSQLGFVCKRNTSNQREQIEMHAIAERSYRPVKW